MLGLIRRYFARIRERQGTLLIGSLVNIAFTGSAVVFYGLGSILVARAIGPEQWGIALWFVSGTTTVALFADIIGVYYSSAYFLARGTKSFSEPVARGTVLVYGAVTGAVVGGVIGFVPPLRMLVFPHSDGFVWAILITSTVAGLCVVNQARGLLLGSSRFLMLGAMTFIKSAGFGILAVILAVPLHMRRAEDVGWAHLGSTVAALLFALAHAWSRGIGRPSLAYLKECARIGWRATGIIVTNFLNLRVDQYMTDAILGATALGLYGVAVSLGEVLTQVPSMVGQVLFPSGAKDDSRTTSARRTLGVTLYTLAGMVVILIGFSMVARPLVHVLYGGTYAASVPLLLAFLPGVAAMAGLLILNPYLSGTGWPAVQLRIMAGVLALKVALNAALLPRMGVLGASVASSISYVVWLALTIAVVAAMSRRPRTKLT